MALVLVLSLIFAFAGCSNNSPAAQPNETTAKEIDWPKKAVTVTLPYAAGGDTDTYCRLMSEKLQKKFGQPFVVVNMTGGSGIVAAKEIMAKDPDGYNILFNHTGASLVQEATGVADFSYTDNFTTVATVAQDNTYTLVAKKDSGWTNLEDMIAYAKANPGKVRYSQVYGSVTHYVCSQMEKTMGVEFNKLDVGTGTSERLAAFMGGQVDLLAVNFMNIKDYVEKGDFVVLGVMSDERNPGMDQFPTFKEQGYDVSSSKNYEVKFPKGTDKAVVDKLTTAIKEVTEDPEFVDTLKKYFAVPFYRTPEQCDQEDKAEVENLKQYFGK